MDTRDKYRQMRQQERERQLHIIRLCILLGTGVILMFAGLAILAYVHQQTADSVKDAYESVADTSIISEPENTFRSDTETTSAVPATDPACETEYTELSDEDYLGILKQQSADLPKLKKILEDPSLYPVSLLQALSKNSEMLDFVLDYPQKHHDSCAETIGDDFVKGSIPTLFQWDERWGYVSYGSETIIAVSGCGPTALSMVVSGLMQDLGLDENAMVATLSAGSPIICSMGPGIFTNSGHFIVLTGYQDGSFTVHDPASKVRSSKTYTFDEFSDQIKNMWYFVRI